MATFIPKIDAVLVLPPSRMPEMLKKATHGEEWKNEALEPAKPAPSKLLPEVLRYDYWLADVWPNLLRHFAKSIASLVYSKPSWQENLRTEHFQKYSFGISKKIGGGLRHYIAKLTQEGKLVEVGLERNQVCPYLKEFFKPFFSKTDSSNAELLMWFSELARDVPPLTSKLTSQTFQRVREGGYWPRAGLLIPGSIKRRELAHDEELMNRWLDAPPVLPKGAKKLLSRVMDAAPIIRSDPSQVIEKPWLIYWIDWKQEGVEIKKQQLLQKYLRAKKYHLIMVPFKGGIWPANLYINQVETTLAPYLFPLGVALIDAGEEGLYGQLMSVAYGLLAHALIPLGSIWHNLDGTCVAETLLPDQWFAVEKIREFLKYRLETELEKSIGRFSRRQKLIVNSFQELGSALLENERKALDQFIGFIGRRSGGRVHLPASGVGFTRGAGWTFRIKIQNGEDENPVERTLHTPERLLYAEPDTPERKPEIFWILRSAWKQLQTAVALINQSGGIVWFNAGNNRWGGKHSPHKSHRQGTSIDFDVGFDSEENPAKVPNVMKRVLELRNGVRKEIPVGDLNLPQCLTDMDRLMTWISIQAFLAIGIWQYLYGDEGLMMEAGEHFITREPCLKVPRPYKIEGTFEPKGHWNHIHFEIWRNPAKQKNLDDYAWIAPTDDLFSNLYEYAVLRDQDPDFWRLMAGLMDEKGNGIVPRKKKHFERTPEGFMPPHISDEEIENWKAWWNRPARNNNGELIIPEDNQLGVPLLPVWNPKKANQTRSAESCKTKIIPENPWGAGEMPT